MMITIHPAWFCFGRKGRQSARAREQGGIRACNGQDPKIDVMIGFGRRAFHLLWSVRYQVLICAALLSFDGGSVVPVG